MADKKEIYARARMMTTAAQLGGKHLREANRDLKDLQNTFTVAEFNALLLAIRMYNLQDRRDNLHLPKLTFAATAEGMVVPDTIVAQHDSVPKCSPDAEAFIRAALENLGRSANCSMVPGEQQALVAGSTNGSGSSTQSIQSNVGSAPVASGAETTATGTYYILSPTEILTFTNESLLPDSVSP